MTPSARVQDAIELIDKILTSSRPADGAVLSFFRGRKFVGAKDRRAISDQAWRIQRTHAKLCWLLGTESPNGRLLVMADLIANEDMTLDRVAGFFSGARYGAPKLSENERRMGHRVEDYKTRTEMPRAVRLEVPFWVLPKLDEAFGKNADAEIAALNTEAPLNLRVNTLKAEREAVLNQLSEENHAPEVTLLSPLGLRVHGRMNLASHKDFRAGKFEVQDEASQICALMVNAKPGQAVLDLCAGAGGKTLAIAAAMNNKGRIVACDVATGRLIRSKQRLRRAGVHNATLRILEGDNDKWVKRQKGTFDRVLVDAPCSGVGSWRRNPDARWRLTPEDLERLAKVQDRVLHQGADAVKKGGRLIYATCSLLPEENQNRVDAFLAADPRFKAVPWQTVWPTAVKTPMPEWPFPYLTLSPSRNGCDGFFLAILERVS
ncbi:MAG: RsmB/NOP family class I SAM-dependent RNA methyltransferase [Rhodospirillaceae bacterium]|nr:RsmB/NOP family class I SAM-dependent RNA methyltransferase [Rhodospirillaceae bacterium]